MSSLSVYQSFRLINIISRVFGVMPLSMVRGDRSSGPICSMSALDYAYSCALLVVSVAHGVLAPFYVLHTSLPHEHRNSIFTTASAAEATRPTDIGAEIDEDEISEMATAMKILNPLMISVACVCSRLVALAFLHRRFGEFIAVLHNTDRLMEATIRSHVTSGSRTFLETLDRHLLRYFAVICVPVNVYYLFTVSAANSAAGVAWCAVLAFNNLACSSTDVQFIRCACMLECRFRIINNELQSIATIWDFKRGLVYWVRHRTLAFLKKL